MRQTQEEIIHLLCKLVFTSEKRHKIETKCVNKTVPFAQFLNIFDIFECFSMMKYWENFLKKLIDSFLLYHTSLRELLRPLEDIACFNFISTITVGHICSDHDQSLLSLPGKLGGFAVSIKTKRENTLTQLQSCMNDDERRLHTIAQEKGISNWLNLYPIAIKGLILLSNHVHVSTVQK